MLNNYPAPEVTRVESEEIMIDRLEEKELEEVSKLISEIVIPELVRIADKYNYDRDSMIKYVAGMFSAMAELATFENWNSDR